MIFSLALDVLAASALFTVTSDSDSISKVVNLGEVKVTSTCHTIDDQGDKIVYNVYLEKVRTDVSTIDLMRKIPTISVDMNGNLSIKGNSNVKILVNGHSLGILSASQVLEQILPSDVLKVEVVSTPGAKYESLGSGGVVNIVTNKKIYFKSSGYLNIGVGTKGSHLMGNFNYSIDKVWTLQNSFYSLVSYPTISNTSNNSTGSDGRILGQLYSYQGGITRSCDRSVFNLCLQYLYQDMAYKEYRINDERRRTTNDYHYLSASTDYSLVVSEKANFDVQLRWYYLPVNSLIRRAGYPDIRSSTNVLGQTAQVDWSLRPAHNVEIETGMSSNYSHFNNLFNTSLIRNIYNFGVYYETKYAVTPMSTLKGGLRYEYYYIDTQFKRKNHYHDFFYNVGFECKLSALSTFSVLFSRRTDRPSYANLLSNDSYQGGNVVKSGDSNIQPSYSYQLEGGLSFYVGDCFLKFIPYYRYTEHSISLLMQLSNGLIQQKFTNLNQQHDYGTEFWATLIMFRGKLNFNGGLDVMHARLCGQEVSNQGWQLSYSMNVTYRLSPSLYVNCYGSWRNKKVYLQGNEDSYMYSNLSLQKSWRNDQYRLAISLDNPFSNGVSVRRNYNINGIDYFSQIHYHNTGVRVFFVKKFGKRDMEKSMKIEQNILNNY